MTCKHKYIRTWVFEDTKEPSGLWSCVDCGLKFEPITQRTWVRLTDEEIDKGLLRSDYAFKTAEAWRAGVVFAMTKLKEKNT